MTEWPLIIFTLLLQTAIGIYLWSTLIKSRNKSGDFKKNTVLVFILSVLSMIISLAHLGVPIRAYAAIFNLGSSWLSREIFFTGLFTGMVFIDLFVNRMENISESFIKTWSWLTSIIGIATVFAIAQIYMNSMMPAWQSSNTMIDFYATTIIMGGIVFLLISRKEITTGLTGICLTVLAVALLQVVFLPVFLTELGSGNAAAQSSIALLAQNKGVMAIQWLLVLAGIFLLIFWKMDDKQGQNYIYVSAISLLVGQIIGRYLFYAAGVSLGFGLM
ncbi:MAG: DmsC/YnfH family molybdoenzyme membrane anchor subunit [Bacillota bacterium]|nr:DmsC/YnfH family molybdoenzyme membrane anchor subunit [Bacillota bacterium]